MADLEPVGEHYVRKLLAMSSCFSDDVQGSRVCFSEPCACAQTLLQEIGNPLWLMIERLRVEVRNRSLGSDARLGVVCSGALDWRISRLSTRQ